MRLWKAMLVVIAAASPAAPAADLGAAGNRGGAADGKPAPTKPPHYVEIPISGPRAELQSAIANPLSSEQDAQLEPLIRKLADSDFRKREEAADALKAMGQSALPTLEEARARATDPEVANRTDSIIRFLKAPAPAPPLRDTDWSRSSGRGRRGIVGRMEGGLDLRVDLDDRTKTVEVRDRENDRTIRISDGPNGIDITISGANAEREVHARTPEMLKKQDEEAFALYQKWMGRGGPGGVIRWRGGRGGQVILPPPVRWPQGQLPPQPQQINPFIKPDAAADQQQQGEMLRMLEELQRNRVGGAAAADPANPAKPGDAALRPAEIIERIERAQREARQNGEALQQQIAELERRAAAAGGAAAPPAGPAIPARNARIGVRVLEGPEPDSITVTEVLPGERAEKLGIKPMDTIRAINGRRVTDGDSLREAIGSAKGPVVVEIVRDGETVKLTEKQPTN